MSGLLRTRCSCTLGLYFIVHVPCPMSTLTSFPSVCCDSLM
ncbi:MAG: hypothetical protein ACOX4E_07625 [Anaerovoracaceae bacterium]